MVRIDPISAFADNYIWALHNARDCVVVDPGDSEPVLRWLAERELSLAAILITHHHADHVGGIEDLRRRYKNVPVIGPASENIPQRTHAMREGDRVTLHELGVEFVVWEIPGHTAGHIAFINDTAAFVGDTVFAAGCGRVFDGTMAQLYHSLARLSTLPAHTRCYCAHEYTLSNLRFALAVEPENDALVERGFAAQAQRERGEPTVPFSIADEIATNPFFRAAQSTIRERCEAHAGHTLDTPLEVFTKLREWKNSFRG